MQRKRGELVPIETSGFYAALKSIGVDDALAREAAEEALARRKIPDDVTASAIYRALCSRNCGEEKARKAVEGVRDSVKWRRKWEEKMARI